METISMKINGKTVSTSPDKTVLQAALDAGIDIPHMCYSEKMKPFGACRLCMVEVTLGNRTRLVASCAYPAQEGLVVETNTDKVKKIRKMIVELIWPFAPELAREYGLTGSRFSNDHNDCSMCGLCVRYCSEIKNKGIFYFKGRGIEREIAMLPDANKECAYCQECFRFCNGGRVAALAAMPWT